MKNYDGIDFTHKNPYKDPSELFYNANNIITVYTILSILLKMRRNLGFEAMVGYIESYLEIVEVHNPNIRRAVSQAMKLIDVKKIYEDAVG